MTQRELPNSIVNKRFLLNAGGIFVAYFFFGILQEEVTRGRYVYQTIDKNGSTVEIVEKFTYAITLVFLLCLSNFLVAKLVLYKWPQGPDPTSTMYYGSVAMTYLLAMISSNMSLQWVAYPTQVVGKAAKPIPVMILAFLIGRKSYPLKKYCFVGLIVTGVVLFMYKDKANSPSDDTGYGSFGLGELLLGLSLLMDGLTGAIQERMRADYKPSGQQMMLASNMWSTLYLAFALILTGEIGQFLQFVSRHPALLHNLLILSLTQSIGQLFLYSMVSESGPLAVSVVTTTRKFFTVLASVLIFGNTLKAHQWLGAVTVFLGLFLDLFFGKTTSKKH